ncbi:MAG: AMP-binding protein [Acidobacteria bacterium]|nr:AMP-binding protein [Acidobacteriota bacterium]
MVTLLRLFVRALLRILYRVEIEGTIPPSAKSLIIANHQSFLDAPIFFAFLPVDALWIVHSQVLRTSIFRFMMRAVDHLVIDTTNPFAMKSTVETVERGRPVLIFPEGRLTVTGALMKVYEGPAFIAAKSGATVVPIIIDGAVYAKGFSRMKHDFPLRWRPKIKLKIFPGEIIPMPEAPSGKLRRRKAGDQMRRLLQRCWYLARPERSLHDAFLDSIKLFGRGRDMVEDATGVEMTFGGLLKSSLALGRLVSKLSQPDEVVGVMMPNVTVTLPLLFGMFGAGRIPAMINYTAGVDGIQCALRAAAIGTIITSRAFLEKAKLTQLVGKLQDVQVVCLEDLRPRFTLADKLWLIFYALRFPRAATHRAGPSDPAIVMFTSGSEGKPKGVVLSHGSIMANMQQALAVFDIMPSDKFFCAMPVFHSFGLAAGFILPMLTGGRVFLYPSPLHYSVVPELFYDRDATILFATPTFLKNYAKRAHPYDLRRMRICVAGAEKLTDEVRNIYAEKFGACILEGYGATECSPVVSINTPMRHQAGAVGEPLPCVECRIEPVAGIEQGGLLHVKGPNIMLGYWRESAPRVLEPPRSIFGEGWYSTGDLAMIDDEGMVRLLGRVKRFAKVAGEMVSLEVVENIAEAASPRSAHGAIVRPDANRGEMIVLCTQDKNLRRDQLQLAGRQMGAPDLAIPRRIFYIDKIPMLGTGKKDYPALSRWVEEELAQPTD